MSISALDERRRRIDIGVKLGVARAIAEHKRAGRSIAVWRDGRVVWLTPAEIPDAPTALLPAEPGEEQQ